MSEYEHNTAIISTDATPVYTCDQWDQWVWYYKHNYIMLYVRISVEDTQKVKKLKWSTECVEISVMTLWRLCIKLGF